MTSTYQMKKKNYWTMFKHALCYLIKMLCFFFFCFFFSEDNLFQLAIKNDWSRQNESSLNIASADLHIQRKWWDWKGAL